MVDKEAAFIRCVKLYFVGPPFVGKTTALNRLLRVYENIDSANEEQKKYESTLLANCIQAMALVSPDKAEWIFSKDRDEEALMVTRYLFGCKKLDKVVKTSKNVSSSSDNITTTRSDEQEQKPLLLKQDDRQFPRQLITPTHSKETETDHSEIISRLEKLVKQSDYSEIMDFHDATLLNLNDIGGQPGFLEMLPALSYGPAMYLMFMNLSKELDKPYDIPFSRDDSVITPFKAAHTVKSTVSQLLSSVHGVHHMSEISIQKQLLSDSKLDDSFSAYLELKPVAALVGTHKDELGIDSEGVQNKELLKKKLEEINQELNPITERFGKTLIYPPTSSARDGNRMCFFALDNKRGSECADIAPLRKILNDSFSTRYSRASLPIPRKWLLLAVILRKEFKIVPLEIVMKLSRVLEMTEEDMKFCIVYLHSIGSLMHFTDVPNDKDEHWQLKNNVICSPQVIFDSVSQLIVVSLRAVHGDYPNTHALPTEQERKELIKKGQFSLETVEMFCTRPDVTKKLEEGVIIPAKQLILLLQYLKVVSEIIHKDTNDPKKTRTTYLMPVMLDCASQDELINSPKPDANNPQPLHITFSFDAVPTGVFCGLITALVSRGPHKILGLTWELVEEGVKRNLVSFYVDYVHKVTLLSHARSYEIRVERNPDQSDFPLHNLCSHVLSVVLYLLNNLYPKLNLSISFQCSCPKHVSSSNPSDLCTLVYSQRMRLLCGRNPVTLNKHQQVWLEKVIVCYVHT